MNSNSFTSFPSSVKPGSTLNESRTSDTPAKDVFFKATRPTYVWPTFTISFSLRIRGFTFTFAVIASIDGRFDSLACRSPNTSTYSNWAGNKLIFVASAAFTAIANSSPTTGLVSEGSIVNESGEEKSGNRYTPTLESGSTPILVAEKEVFAHHRNSFFCRNSAAGSHTRSHSPARIFSFTSATGAWPLLRNTLKSKRSHTGDTFKCSEAIVASPGRLEPCASRKNACPQSTWFTPST